MAAPSSLFNPAKSFSLRVNLVQPVGFINVKKLAFFSFSPNCFSRKNTFGRILALGSSSTRVESQGHSHSNTRSRIAEDSFNLLPEESDNIEVELQYVFDEVKNLIKLGKQDDARDLLRANYQAAMELIDDCSKGEEVAAGLDVIALGYMAIGDLRTVESILDVMRNVVDGLKGEEMYLDSVLMHMGGLYAKLEKPDLSINFYQRSLQIMEKRCGNDSSSLCNLLLGMAQALASGRRVSEAIETYKRIIKIIGVNSTGEGEEVILPLCEMGNLLLEEGKILEAEFAFSRVIDIFVRLYGEKDGRVGMAMCSLAQVKCVKGKVNEAIDLYRTAIEIFSVSMALDDEVVERIRTELAELLHVAGRAEEGRAVLEETLFLREKAKGKGHPSMVAQLVNLASSHSRSKNYGESERLLRLGLEILVKNAPPDDPSVTFPMLDLALNLYQLQRYEEAEELTLKVISIREKAFGAESVPVGEALDCLVCIWRKLGKDGSEVVEAVRRVLRIEEKYFGSESVEVMETLKKMVYLADKMGLKNERFGLRRRLVMLGKKHRF